jgi:hypothetical protein
MLADFSSEFHDLCGSEHSVAVLDPVSYLASHGLATQLVNADSMGIIYSSVRCESGTILACFRPALVGNLRRGAAFRLSWSGSPEPVVKPLLTN